MTYDEWRADFLIMLEYHRETIDIDIHIWYKRNLNRGFDKYKDLTINQLILVRNHLHNKIHNIGLKLGNQRTFRNS